MNDIDDLYEDETLEERLRSERPVPSAAFRSRLHAHLLERSRSTPQRLRLMIGAYAGSGVMALMLAALGVLGLGPLAA